MNVNKISSFSWSQILIQQLIRFELGPFYISPGSRSTSLVLALDQYTDIIKKIVIDERSAAFQALGSTKASGIPSVLLCTSGTAVSNYFPAIVEAYQSKIPIIILTADRPYYLVNSGSPQTINQERIYGRYAQYFDLDQNKLDEESLSRMFDSIFDYLEKGYPIHLNIPLEKPFEPNALVEKLSRPTAKKKVRLEWEKDITSEVNAYLKESANPLFIFGPQSIPNINFKDMEEWLIGNQIPYLSESLSQLNSNIRYFESKLRNPSDYFASNVDLIVRFGQQPVSKGLDLFLNHTIDIKHIHIDKQGFEHDASFSTDQHLFGKLDISQLEVPHLNEAWKESFKSLLIHTSIKSEEIRNDDITDGSVYQILSKLNFDGAFVSNSFPIRDIDLFSTFNNTRIFANRGASGIDGIISTSLAISNSFKRFITIIGDIAFQHDATALASIDLNKQTEHTILIINNDGGRIFEMLPIAEKGKSTLDTYFTTKQHVEFEKIAQAFNINFTKVKTKIELANTLKETYSGTRIIECVSNHKLSMSERQHLWNQK